MFFDSWRLTQEIGVDAARPGLWGAGVIQMALINDLRNESGIRYGTAPNFGAKHAVLRICAISGRFPTWWIDAWAAGMGQSGGVRGNVLTQWAMGLSRED
jgi:hypothetical protein